MLFVLTNFDLLLSFALFPLFVDFLPSLTKEKSHLICNLEK